MLLKEDNEKRQDEVRRIKRNCLLCCTRKDLDPRGRERKIVLESLEGLKKTYNELYDSNRKENLSAEEITGALDNKRVCMDALDLCRKCDKDFEKVSRFLSGR